MCARIVTNVFWLAVAVWCVRGAYAPPSRSAKGLGDFSDLLAEADPAGAAGAACSALGRLGAGRLRARVPVPVRVQAATLRKASGHGVAKAGLFILAPCWLSSVIGGVSFFRRLPPERA